MIVNNLKIVNNYVMIKKSTMTKFDRKWHKNQIKTFEPQFIEGKLPDRAQIMRPSNTG